jgi:hypothetical protein
VRENLRYVYRAILSPFAIPGRHKENSNIPFITSTVYGLAENKILWCPIGLCLGRRTRNSACGEMQVCSYAVTLRFSADRLQSIRDLEIQSLPRDSEPSANWPLYAHSRFRSKSLTCLSRPNSFIQYPAFANPLLSLSSFLFP